MSLKRVKQGRPSKLSDYQKAEIGRRLAQGESASSLAREFKVGKATISRIFSEHTKIIKSTARTLADAELLIESLPISEQVSVRSLADQIKGMQADYTVGAADGMKTAALLHGVARKKAQELDPATLQTDDLRLVAALATTANQAASMGSTLLNAKKDVVPREPDVFHIYTGVPRV